MIQLAITVATLLAVTVLVWFGELEERMIAAAVIIVLALTPIADDIQFNQIRPVVAALEAFLLIVFFVLAILRDRWWLLALTAFQGVSLSTHLVPIFAPDLMLWTAVTVRLEVWCLIILAMALGAWEAKMARAR